MSQNDLKTALSFSDATYIGGGTDIMPLLKYQVRHEDRLVFVSGIPELQGIEDTDACISIGAAETLDTIARSALIRQQLPALSEAAEATASPQIRHIATLGGNIMQDRRCIYFNQPQDWRSAFAPCFKTGGCVCHQIPNSPVCRAIYYSDPATALLLYEAQVVYWENGERHTAPAEEFINRHCENNGLSCEKHDRILIERFLIPKRAPEEVSTFWKYALRASIDFPLVNFALSSKKGCVRIVAGAVSTAPVVLGKTAALLCAGGYTEEELLSVCRQELKQLSKPIKEALITPAVKQELYRQILIPAKKLGLL